MTKEYKVKVLAELDGYSFRDESARYPTYLEWQSKLAVYKDDSFVGLLGGSVNFDNYLTSYDAIIPLIQKQPRHILNKIGLKIAVTNDIVECFKHTPEGLADILIKVIKSHEILPNQS